MLPLALLLCVPAVLALKQSNGVPLRMHPLKADKELGTIFEQNKKWVDKSISEDPEYFSRLATGQNPQILWIGCSDSRVPANRIMGLDTGDVFVVRNIANQVIGTDISMMAVLQYGVNVLRIPHIVVCGHYDCGGVRAAMENIDHLPPLENWLRKIRDTYRLHRIELDAIEEKERRYARLVELNVVEQCIEIFKTGVVQRRRVETYCSSEGYVEPRIHAVVYDPANGALNKLPIDFGAIIEDLGSIYNLYEPECEVSGMYDEEDVEDEGFTGAVKTIAETVETAEVPEVAEVFAIADTAELPEAPLSGDKKNHVSRVLAELPEVPLSGDKKNLVSRVLRRFRNSEKLVEKSTV